MNIGFDLDGIFIDTPPFVSKKLIEWLYRGHNHRLFYRIPSVPEQFIRRLTHYPIFRPSISENVELMKRLKTNSNKFYLISSRFGFLKDRTESIISRYQLADAFAGMYFNYENKQPHVFKDEIIKMLEVDRYVDDDLALLGFLAKENPKLKFYWLNKKQKESLGKNLFAIALLSDVFA